MTIQSGSLCALFNGVRQRHIAGVVQAWLYIKFLHDFIFYLFLNSLHDLVGGKIQFFQCNVTGSFPMKLSR